MSTPMRRTRLSCCAPAVSGHAAARDYEFSSCNRDSHWTPLRQVSTRQRDYTKFWWLHEPAHTTAVTAGRLLWVISTHNWREHFSSAFPESGLWPRPPLTPPP